MNAPVSLEAICDLAAGDAYPRDLLAGCDTALVLFAAGFHGRQDAYWIQDAGLEATCVDLDADRLLEMQRLYPRSWKFRQAEAFEYAATTRERFDLVSIDCPTGAFQRCATLLELWCSLARLVVVLGCGPDTYLEPHLGWAVTDMRKRSDFKGGVYWAVLERQ